ncbi:hypothetical protein [Methylobacterium sp. E-066]|uniref:hypothetical protein n=1 Tax=Methylobacterium sp. E-066 TaxID=2836584 RepID=UPI001FBB6B92|nr:hypothetical protein [Methylobacterium sp. E-066]MCJ2143679.1 hypothetical protein [Methylobacterium sp. E-066]
MSAPAQRQPDFGTYRLDQLGFCQCRYPGALVRGEHRFCGRPTVMTDANKYGSWCDEHLPVVFTPRAVVARRKAGGA